MGLKISQAEDILTEEYKSGLKQYLEEGLNELSKQLSETKEDLNPVQVYSFFRQRNRHGGKAKYSTAELELAFEYYQQYIEKINGRCTFPPTQKNFCGLLGISSNQYNLWRESDEAERREIMQRIDDYITDMSLALAQAGQIKEVTTIFRSKAENKMVEASAPIVHITEKHVNLDNMMAQVKALQEGRPIELKKTDEGDYE